MDLVEIARAFPDLCITVRLGDLLAANEALARKVRDEARREREELTRDGDRLIPREEARQRLGGPDPSTLWRWERAGYLSVVRIGGRVFYRQSDINKIMQSKTI